MLRLPCRILDCPKPKFAIYNGQTKTTPPIGFSRAVSRWKVPINSQFHGTVKSPKLKYRFIIETGMSADSIQKYREFFRVELLLLCHLSEKDSDEIDSDVLYTRDGVDTKITAAKFAGANLVVFLLRKASTPFYANLKDLADRKYGIHSLCLIGKLATMKKGDSAFTEYMINVIMKINLKLGGINQSVPELKQYLETNRVMVLGADVVHAGPGSFPGTPSIAAMVGSVDYSAGKCLGSMRLQRVDRTDREVSMPLDIPFLS
jgi:eukaryotic translation initiation factor 2C